MSRMLPACLALLLVCCLFGTPGPGAALGQKANPNQKVAQLEKQIANLNQQLNQLRATNKDLSNQLTQQRKNADSTVKDLQTLVDGYQKAGLVHVVILKLRSGAPSDEVQSLVDDANNQLAKIKSVRGLWAGKPASKPTPEAANDYTVALVLVFDDATGLKKYLDDPAHKRFADRHLKNWEKPLVYDFQPSKPPQP